MRAAVLILAATLVATGCGSESSSSGRARSVSAATTCCLATVLTSEAGVIESAARDLFGDDYAGLGVVDDELAVFTTSTIPEVLPDELEGVPIRRVRFNLSELEAFKLRVDASRAEASDRGVVLSVWGIDPATNSISIGVASDPEVARTALPEVIGNDVPITIHAEGIPVT